MSEHLPRIAQPWYDHEIHRQDTRALGLTGDGTGAGGPTIHADPAEATRHLAFLASLSPERDLRVRQGDVGGDEIMQWYAQYQDRDDDTPDGPREEQSE